MNRIRGRNNNNNTPTTIRRFVVLALLIALLSCHSCYSERNLRSIPERDAFTGGASGGREPDERDVVPPSDDAFLERVFVSYDIGERNVALQTLASETSMLSTETSTTVLYDFAEFNSFVMLATRHEIENLERHVYVERDPPRYMMHIPESVQPITTTATDGFRHGRNLQNTQHVPYGVEMVEAPEAWEHGIRGEGVKVCVVDTGLDVFHNDLVGEKVVGEENGAQWENDFHGHGTHIAGTIVAADNYYGVVGVAPDVDVFVIKVFDRNGDFAFSSGLIAAARRCRDMGARVINMSLGGSISSRLESLAFERLYDEGIVLVSAAGNSGGTAKTYPASYDSVISVAGIDENKRLGYFSQRNNAVNIAAPGVRIMSLLPDNRYGYMSGTSMATPHVTGVAALLLSYKSDATASDVFAAIVNSAEDLGLSGKDISYGNGLVSAKAALQYLNNGQPIGGGNNGPSAMFDDPEQQPCVEIAMQLFTDGYPEENNIELTISDTGEQIWELSGNDLLPHQEYYYKTCEDRRGCYTFRITDSYGDGLCCEFGTGGLAVFYDDIPISRGYFFGKEQSFRLGEGCWDEERNT